MQTPEEVAAMLRLKALGWGIKRIAKELGCSHMTVRHYVAQGGWACIAAAADRASWPVLRHGLPNASGGMPAMPMWCDRSFLPRGASPEPWLAARGLPRRGRCR